jgi:cobalt-zinc-cadmium efflux system outer membrane protein
MKTITSIIALLALALIPHYGSAETSRQDPSDTNTTVFSEASTIDDYLGHALHNNRGLRASEAMWQSIAERINQAGFLEDPDLSFQYMFEQHDMQYQATLTQMIPGFGKLRLNKRIASAHASTAKHEYEAMRLMVFENVIKAFYNYHYLERATAVTDENITLLTELENVLLTRYKSGTAQYSDVLKAQVEKDRLLNQLAGLKDMRSVKSAGLSALLDLPLDHILPWPKATRSADATFSDSVLFDMLDTLNPELKAMAATIEELYLSVKLAKKTSAPNFMVGAGYMVMPETQEGSTPSDVMVMVGVSIPLWRGKYKSAANEASFAHQSAVSRRKQLESNIQVELRKALFDLHDADRRIKLLKESLIPKAQQAFEVAQQEFMGGTTPFITLIDAQRTLFELSLDLAQSEVDRETAFGEIGCCVGKYDIGALDRSNTPEEQKDHERK